MAEPFRTDWRTAVFEHAGLVRRIAWSGTDEQKAELADARTKVLAAMTEATKSLHSVLATSQYHCAPARLSPSARLRW
jgi:hypothetical protein